MLNLSELVSSNAFMPHGHCYLWRTDILWLNVIADGLVAFSYFLIPTALIFLVRRRQDLVFNWLFVMFATFIVACGLTHVMSIYTIWSPIYGWEGLLKLFTGMISAITAVTIWTLMPKLLSFPGPVQFESINLELKKEINERIQAENQLLNLNKDLEERVQSRTHELSETNSILSQSEITIAKQAERMKSVLDHVADAIITFNQELRIESWNKAASIIFGYESDEAIGQHISRLIPDSNIENLFTLGMNSENKLDKVSNEFNGKKKDETFFPIDIAISDFKLDGSQYFTGIIRDITDRQFIASELLAAKEAAEAASQAKSDFLANMSHEIRTPLSAVLGFSELLLNNEISGKEKISYESAIKRNGELLRDVINDVLDLSKVEAGKMTVEKQEIRVDDVLADLNSLCLLQAREKGIELVITTTGALPTSITTDRLKLRQILLNIVGNAIKFTSKGNVTVDVNFAVLENGAPRLNFKVKDTGIGLTPEHTSRLFQPFTQADSSIKRRHGGTGLGLALSKKLAQLLDGDVSLLESTLGVGSTFLISINPGVVDMGKLLKIASATRSELDRPNATIKTPLVGIKMLLVEDSLDIRMLVKHILSAAGAEVETAENGKIALELIQKNSFVIVLMDLQMPVMDGFEAITELRRKGSKLPVIALTAHAFDEEYRRCLEKGFNDHMAKPIKRDELYEKILKHVASSL